MALALLWIRGMGLVLLFLGFLAAVPDRSAFVGEWKMDAARSESAHQDVPTGSSKVRIEHTETGLRMETTRTEDGKPAAFHEILNLKTDGSETVSAGDSGVEVTAKAHWDGSKLVVETVRTVQDSTVTTVYVHTVAPGGREMTIDKTLSVQHGYQGVGTAPNTGHGKDVFVRVVETKP
jgi:Na+-transporting methylmalonyl-CoA/oxaloacetate decarboxylase gamma subunit